MKRNVALILLSILKVAVHPVYARNFCDEVLARMNDALKPTQMHYTDTGGDKTPLILIHGLDSAGPTFTPIFNELAEQFRVITIDQRGHGKTEDAGEDFSSALLAADLKALTNYLGVKRFHLLGHSMGARTAVRFAAAFPDQVISLIIEDMSVSIRSFSDPARYLERSRKLKVEMPTKFANLDELIKALKFHLGSKRYPMTQREALSLAKRRARKLEDGSYELLWRPHVSFLYGGQGNQESLKKALASTSMPLLIIYPQSYGILDKTAAKAMKRRRGPNVTLAKIRNATHNVHGTNTSEFLKALHDFFNSQEPPM